LGRITYTTYAASDCVGCSDCSRSLSLTATYRYLTHALSRCLTRLNACIDCVLPHASYVG
jgi:hypothetical protein